MIKVQRIGKAMKITSAIIRREFIGTEIKIKESKNQTNVGISGKIIDETRNTFTISHKGKKRRIIKSPNTFHFHFPDGTIVEIAGRLLIGRPENRIKRHTRRLW